MKNNNGFTLIELSIVLIIISLIVGGVVGGRSLIKSAELKAVIDDVNKFQSALNIFVDQYDAFSGDMVNASEYWPTCDTPATNCDGDGNNRIEFGAGEELRVFQMLSLADILDGTYTGKAVGVGFGHRAGINLPESKINGGGYFITYFSGSTTFPDISGHAVQFAKFNGVSAYDNGIITSSEAKILDKKMDDGIAYSGRFAANNGADSAANSCVTGSPVNYNLSQTGKDCRLLIGIN